MVEVLIIFLFLLPSFVHASDSDGDSTMMSIPPATTDACLGLQKGETDRMDGEIGDPLFEVPQINDQDTVLLGTGVQNERGEYWGGCATYTSLARVVAILNNENLPIPPEFQYTEENMKKFYKKYGDKYNKGAGDARIVTANILQEYKALNCRLADPELLLPQYLNMFDQIEKGPLIECSDLVLQFQNKCDPRSIDKYLANPNEKEQLKQRLNVQEFSIVKTNDGKDVTQNSLKAIFEGIADGFNRLQRLPIEFIHAGNLLNSTKENTMPSVDGRDRGLHVSLITGRRLTANGVCEILVRNSYWTRCDNRTGPGKHIFTKRDCDGDTDSTWFTESHMKRFVGEVRTTEPLAHPASRNFLAIDKKKEK